jgi:hypothetical protein
MQDASACLAQTLRDAGWAPAAVFVLHLVAARVFNAYRRFPDLDIPMHLLGGIAIAFFFHKTFLNASRLQLLPPYHRLNHIALAFGFTCAAAVFWEFAEFLSDRYLGTNAQGDDLRDTLFDMLLGISGGSLCLAIILGRR